MQMESFSWIAIFAATLAGFAAGGIWYAPFVFGPLWSQLNPMDPEHTGRRDAWRYAASLALNFLQALVLYFVLLQLDTFEPASALWIAFLLWAGFTMAPSLAETVFTRRPLSAWLLDAVHRLVIMLVMALVLVFIH